MSTWRIPFNRPTLLGSEFDYMRKALESGRLSGGGEFAAHAEKFLEGQLGAARVLLTPSGTAALEMAALLLKLEPGDEVIVPSFTFVSTANAFHQFGARIVFADIRPDTFNIDERQVAQLVTPRTRAVVAVHYAGVGANMEALLNTEALLNLNLPVIEDNAHGLFGRFGNKALGSFGPAAATSFHETKSFTCGEGGALILNQPSWIERAEVLREKGTNRTRFFLGQVDKYTWVDRGSSYLLSELSAAFLLAQLERWHEVQSRRQAVWERYAKELEDWACAHAVRLPYIPGGCHQSYHMFYLLLPGSGARDRLISHLAERGILAVFHYVPLDSSPRGRSAGIAPLGCPVTADVSARLVRLPFFTGLSEEDQTEVIRAVREFSPVKTYDPVFFEDLRKIQARHFWFVARNRVIGAVAATLLPGPASRILEVGCGSGSVLPTLAGLQPAGLVVGLDLYREALSSGVTRAPAQRHDLVQADAAALPFGAEFHLAGCFDVSEHMDDDVAVAAGIGLAIRRGGWLLVTVPAGPGLWSAFDEAAMHRRRYTEAGLGAMLRKAGFEVVFASPFMSATYPLLWAQRRIARKSEGRQAVRDGIRIVPGLNGILNWSLRWEPEWLAARKHLPFGSSLLAIARLRG